ncbi:MAG: ABC transporter permease, partial [Rubrivivax sp.]|nr:ABC transporter permease [Rubrivivax sp.]
MPKFVLLWTDAAMWMLAFALVAYGWHVGRSAALSSTWRKVFRDPAALASSVVLLLCLGVTLADSVHYRPLLPPAPGAAAGAAPAYEARTRSLLDAWLDELVASREATYSRPLAYLGFTKESIEVGGRVQRLAPRLKFGGAHLRTPEAEWAGDVAARALTGLAAGALVAAALAVLFVAGLARARRRAWRETAALVWHGEGDIPWRVAVATAAAVCLIVGPATLLSGPYHLLGTDLTGNDVLYQALKSIRTAFVIGTLATV